jgi:hypothetical protein
MSRIVGIRVWRFGAEVAVLPGSAGALARVGAGASVARRAMSVRFALVAGLALLSVI